jgi:hypothetical protein
MCAKRAVADFNNVDRGFCAIDADSEWDFMVGESQLDGRQLGSIHLLALAHILRRPILVHGPNELPQPDGSPGPNVVRGVYLPLLIEPNGSGSNGSSSFGTSDGSASGASSDDGGGCIKEPLVVFFQGSHFTALCRIDDEQPTPGLVQLDFVTEVSVEKRGEYSTTYTYEKRHQPLPLRYNVEAKTGRTNDEQMARYLDLQTVWAGLADQAPSYIKVCLFA